MRLLHITIKKFSFSVWIFAVPMFFWAKDIYVMKTTYALDLGFIEIIISKGV